MLDVWRRVLGHRRPQARSDTSTYTGVFWPKMAQHASVEYILEDLYCSCKNVGMELVT